MDSKDPVEMAREAAKRAVNCPLLEADIKGAKNAIINVSGGDSLTIENARSAVDYIKQVAGSDVDIIFGLAYNNALRDSIIVTIIATGFESLPDENLFTTKTYEQPAGNKPVSDVDIPDFFNYRSE